MREPDFHPRTRPTLTGRVALQEEVAAAATRECRGCGATGQLTLECPQCVKAGVKASFFCSQGCFKAAWAQHKRQCHAAVPAGDENGAGKGKGKGKGAAASSAGPAPRAARVRPPPTTLDTSLEVPWPEHMKHLQEDDPMAPNIPGSTQVRPNVE